MRLKPLLAGAGALVAAAGLMTFDLNPAASQTAPITALRARSDPGLDPGAAPWDDAQEVTLPLAAQTITYPFGGGGTSEVRVRALHHDGDLFVRIAWDDSSRNSTTRQVRQFTDAAAIEFPAEAGSSVPAVCMGQADGGVNIWQWRADHDAARRDGDDAYVDEEPPGGGYAPAEELGNPVALGRAAQDLVAEGFGTLEKATSQQVSAHGRFSRGGPTTPGTWTVVFRRPLAKPGPGQPGFGVGDTVDVAFAVWNGAEGERNGLKSVSDFARLELAKGTQPSEPWQGWWFVLLPVAALALYGTWRLIRQPRSTAETP